MTVCDSCDGFGSYRQTAEPKPAHPTLLARLGRNTLDESDDCSVEEFIARLVRTWPTLRQKVTIWERGEDGLRVVAVVGPDATGRTAARQR